MGDYASFGYEMVVFEDKTYTGKRKAKEAKSYFSDDPNASKFARTSGDCRNFGGSLHQWEDGGSDDFLDFQFRMTCKETVVKTGNLRLFE